jgi:hypothetical protein
MVPWSATRALLAAAVLLIACRPSQSELSRPDLAGTWTAEFRLGSGSQAKSVRGTINLASTPLDQELCPGREADCASVVNGTHAVPFDSLLGRLLSSHVTAGVIQSGEIVFLFGECCDQGEISARGALEGTAVQGQWIETALGPAREGKFVITRLQ